jgi:hypothetical protein
VVTGTPAKRLFGRLFVIQSVAEVSKLAKAAKGLGLYEYHFHQVCIILPAGLVLAVRRVVTVLLPRVQRYPQPCQHFARTPAAVFKRTDSCQHRLIVRYSAHGASIERMIAFVG